MFLVFLFLLFGCSPSESHFHGEKMLMPYEVRTDSRRHYRKTQELIDACFERVNLTYNHWNPRSELSQVNNSTEQSISSDLLELFTLSSQLHQLSGGRFDPSMAPLISKMKRDAEIAHAEYGWEHLIHEHIDAGWSKIRCAGNRIDKPQELKLDFDSIAKGKAVDLIFETLEHRDLYVSWGGEIRVRGRPRRIAISNPLGGEPVEIVELKDSAIATSGSCIQTWNEYSHFIDAKTQQPKKNSKILSVTVMAPTCALADGLATAGMLFDNISDLQGFVKKVESEIAGTRFWIVTSQSEL
ncbi:MAG: FAD:protein FMN transferase [Simkaniaceae bacterium]|nr:FAD:protein FMN transferase [Simkaniaceae bacterium]